MKTETARQKNEKTNKQYGALLSGSAQQFNYLVKTKQTFAFTITHYFNSTDYTLIKSEKYKNKYIIKSNDFLKDCAKYAYNTEKAIYNFSFSSFNSQFVYETNNFLKNYPEFRSLISAEGSSYNYAESNTKTKKPRIIMGVVKDGVLYDYTTYSKDPTSFNYVGVSRYFNSLTYTSNAYMAQFVEYQSTNGSMICPENASSDRVTVGCRLGNDSNSYLIYYQFYNAQYLTNLLTSRNFLVYNYDSLNEYNRYFYNNIFPKITPKDSKIYIADTQYYTYDSAKEEFGTTMPKKRESYQSSAYSYVPLLSYYNQNSIVDSYHSSITNSYLPYFAYARNNKYVSLLTQYDYKIPSYDMYYSNNLLNYDRFNELLNNEYEFTEIDSDTNNKVTLKLKNNYVTSFSLDSKQDDIDTSTTKDDYIIKVKVENKNYDVEIKDFYQNLILPLSLKGVELNEYLLKSQTYISSLDNQKQDENNSSLSESEKLEVINKNKAIETTKTFLTNIITLATQAIDKYTNELTNNKESIEQYTDNDLKFAKQELQKYWDEINEN